MLGRLKLSFRLTKSTSRLVALILLFGSLLKSVAIKVSIIYLWYDKQHFQFTEDADPLERVTVHRQQFERGGRVSQALLCGGAPKRCRNPPSNSGASCSTCRSLLPAKVLLFVFPTLVAAEAHVTMLGVDVANGVLRRLGLSVFIFAISLLGKLWMHLPKLKTLPLPTPTALLGSVMCVD